MSPQEQIQELLLQWEEAQEGGRPVSAEELCAGRPDLLPELRRCIQRLRAVDQWLESPSTVGFLDPSLKECPQIAGYEILGEVARGGMGVVYRARHVDLDQERAVKVMAAGPGDSARALQRFQREMRILARLGHENIVPVYEAQCVGGQPFFIMPFVPGGSLAEHLPRFRDRPAATARLMEQVAGAIHHAHELGILHRDLKPSNILLGAGDRPLVSDFGVAKVLTVFRELARAGGEAPAAEGDPGETSTGRPDGVGSTGAGAETIEGAMVGTWPYMAPEQIRGEAARIGPRADVWALGVILYQVLAGKRPFPGPRPKDYLAQIPTGDFEPLHRVDPRIDRTLSAIVGRCLRRDPEERYPSARALADDLRAWRTGRRVRGVPETYRRRARRWLRAAVLPACLLAVVAASVAAAVWLGREDPPDQQYLARVGGYLDRLRAGETVSLAAGRFRYGAGQAFPGTDGRPLEVQANGAAVYELLPEIPLEDYRIRARLRQTHGGLSNDSLVGVCWGFGEFRAEGEGYRSFTALAYSDLGPKPTAGMTTFQTRHWVYSDPIPSEPGPRKILYLTPHDQPRGDFSVRTVLVNGQAPVRELVVEVRGGSLRTSITGVEERFDVTAADLAARAQEWERSVARGWPAARNWRPLYDPGGGVGLFVNGSAVAVEQFDVEPLR